MVDSTTVLEQKDVGCTEHFGEEAVDNIPPDVVESRVAAPTQFINIGIRDYTGRGGVTFFRIHLGQRLGTLFQEYGRRIDVDNTKLRFLLDGERILDEQTAKMLELADQGVIDCMPGQYAC
jgi:hypothetical protein